MRLELGLVAMCCALVVPIHASQDPAVWFWFATCGGPAMTLEVRFDKTVVEKTSFPLCRAPREGPESQGQAGRIEFSFTARRIIVWRGYRETSDRSRPGQALDVNIWQAGADPQAVTLGISVTTADRILMNMVHVAHSDRRDESTIAPGLTLTTYPTPVTR